MILCINHEGSMAMNKMKVGKNIRKYRLEASLSQSELGEKINVANQTISSWELDRTSPPIEAIEKMSILFGCDKSDLLGIQKANVPSFDPRHIELIDLFSKLNPEQQDHIMNTMRIFISSNNNQ